MGEETPQWTEGSLRWSPSRADALAPARAGPWSPATAAAPQEAPIALWPWRLGFGLAQGLALFLLANSRAAGSLPGANPFLFDALALPALFVPLLLAEGIGSIAPRRLLPFALLASAMLAALGWYQSWRLFGTGQAHGGLSMIVLAGLALFIAAAFLHGRERAGRWRIAYPDLFAAGWVLAARLGVWLLACGAALSLLHSPVTPPLHLEDGDLFAMLLMGVTGALAFQLTAALPAFTAALAGALVAAMTIALPLALALGLLLLSAALGDGPSPLVVLLTAMLALVIAMGASHRGETDVPRKAWRDGCELFGALLLLPLAGLGLWALAARVEAFGWTAARIYAAAALTLLACYGLGYGAAALITLLRGGRQGWLRPIARINVVLGVAAMLGALLLASPLTDPMRLAASAQAARLNGGRVAVEHFDFPNLLRDSARYGGEALAAMTASPYPDIARAAAMAHDGHIATAPNPTEVGANIAVRTLGAHLPATLLARNWTGVAGAPPCLTRALESCDAYFLDLDGDGGDEILLVSGNDARWWGAVMKADLAGRWSAAGRIAAPSCGPSLEDLRAGRFTLVPPRPGFRDLAVAGMRLSVVPTGTGCNR